MKKFLQVFTVLLLLTSFTAMVVRVNTNNTLMSSEEELVEHGSLAQKKAAEDLASFRPFDFFASISSEAENDGHMASQIRNGRDSWLNYQNPYLDIPLLPPEVKA